MACSCRNVTTDGTPETASPWVQSVLGDCIYTPMEWLSFSLGMLSIACWLVAQLPQLYKNYKNQASESLSIVFLINWFSGDLFNLVGCILTDQLPIQKITAVYYITMDVVLLSQFKYYDWKKSRTVNAAHLSMQQPLLGNSESSSSGAVVASAKGKKVAPALAVTLAMVCVVGVTFALAASPAAAPSALAASRRLLSMDSDVASSAPFSSSLTSSTSTPASTSLPLSSPPTTSLNPNATASADSGGFCDDIGLLLVTHHDECVCFSSNSIFQASSSFSSSSSEVPDWSSSGGWDVKIGVLIGWISGVIYLSSRIPQLRLNYKRRSVEGLSPGMFTMAIMGNLTYGTSLLLRPLSMVYFVSRLPWLVGSLCVCFFDMCILAQFFKYGDAKSLPT